MPRHRIRTELLPLSFNVTADVFGDKGYIVEMYSSDFEICLTPEQADTVGLTLIRQAEVARAKQRALEAKPPKTDCRCAGPAFDPDVACPVPGHFKLNARG